MTTDDAVLPLGGGRVNRTWAVGSPSALVLQQLSDHYFTDPQAVMDNLARILGHLEWRQAFIDRDADRWFPQLASTEARRAYHIEPDGGVWRAFHYIDGTIVPKDGPANAGPPLAAETIRSIAEIYGRFVAMVDDFGGTPLEETIPEFRSAARIRAEFDEVWAAAGNERRARVQDAYGRASALSDQLGPLDAALPLRVVHNDTKLPNVVLRGAPPVACAVIDLDLVMQGRVATDFGDLFRSASHYLGVGFDLVLFEELATAYVRGSGGVLSNDELRSLATGPAHVCNQLAWRYLTDCLREVPKLRVADPQRSLDKAHANLTLAEDACGNQDEADAVAERLVSASERLRQTDSSMPGRASPGQSSPGHSRSGQSRYSEDRR